MSRNTRLVREDFTGIYLQAGGAIYRPARSFAGRLDQMPITKGLAALEALDPAITAAYPQMLDSIRDQIAQITRASRRKTTLRSRDRPVVTLIDGTPIAHVGPNQEIWATGHPADSQPRTG